MPDEYNSRKRSINITSFHSNPISIVQLNQLSILVKHQSAYILYKRFYQVEDFCIETSILERLHTDYSNKNILIPAKEEYQIQLLLKIESALKLMRWKAVQFLGKLEISIKGTYGFKSRKCTQKIDELIVLKVI